MQFSVIIMLNSASKFHSVLEQTLDTEYNVLLQENATFSTTHNHENIGKIILE